MNWPEVLAGYRALVEPAWSAKTAHPRYAGIPGRPLGQCGVTSAWLQKRLREDHGIDSTYCVGEVFGHGDYLDHHCWLEVDGVVVDLTVDQMWPDEPFTGADLLYRVSWRMEPDERVLERVAVLERGLADA